MFTQAFFIKHPDLIGKISCAYPRKLDFIGKELDFF
jgi:hypothetical protein